MTPAFIMSIRKFSGIIFIVIYFMLITIDTGYTQNVAITDDDAYTAHSSAMLDVKSTTKGMLVPRVTTAQMNAIVSPATGLLIFNTTDGSYYFYTGADWTNFSFGNASGIWSYTAPNIYMTNSGDYLGLGTSSPLHKLHVSQSLGNVDGTDGVFIDIHNRYNASGYGNMSGIRFANGTSGNPDYAFKGGIFYRDSRSWNRGDLIFANLGSANANSVTADDARMIIRNTGNVEIIQDPVTGADDAIFNVVNSSGDTVFAVYPEGVRIWVGDDGAGKASKGGFAVGGFSTGKGVTNEYLRVSPDSVRIYIDDEYGAKASKGGFAVGGFSTGKAFTDDYLHIVRDSSRLFVDGDGGFSIGDIQTGPSVNYLDITPQNYFIGHESGNDISSGLYNSFLGYQSGYSNSSGSRNVFVGYKTGYGNVSGSRNIYVGNQTGYSNGSGSDNIFIGYNAGYNNISGYNTFVGTYCGENNTYGAYNSFIGYQSGVSNTTGGSNCYMGFSAGWASNGDYNTAIGLAAGQSSTTGYSNVYIGAYCAGTLTDYVSSKNVIVGTSAGYNIGDGTEGNVFLGYKAGYDETGSNRLYIENSDASNPLIFGEFDNDRIGINDGVPSANLHVKQVGAGEEGLAIENDGDTDVWAWEVGTNDLQFFFNGTYIGYWDDADGSYNATSDKRLKKDIEIYDKQVLSGIMNIDLVSYRLLHSDKSAKKTIGFLAQDVQKQFPELVSQREDGYLSLNYDNFGILSVKAIQEQQLIMDELINDIDLLKSENSMLKAELEDIRSALNIREKK